MSSKKLKFVNILLTNNKAISLIIVSLYDVKFYAVIYIENNLNLLKLFLNSTNEI